jgi:hypothetical protein
MGFGNLSIRTFVRITALGRRFLLARRGSVAILMGLVLPAVIGTASLGAEVTFVLFKHRQMQSAADAAALSGATAIKAGYPGFSVEALAITAALGFQNQINGVTITANNPPTSGPNVGKSSAVEVIVSQPQTLFLVTLFRSGLFNLVARAVAIAGSGPDCVLQLNGSSALGVSIGNGADVNLINCGLAADSTGSPALSVTGGAVLTTQSVSTSGSTATSNGGTINAANGIENSQPPVPDPYAGVAMPPYSGCSFNNKMVNSGMTTLSPGVYCNGLSLGNGGTVTMSPGVYFIDRGTFSVQGGVTLTGTGVTIVLTSNTGSGYAIANIANGTNVTLSAPTTGATAGIVFFGDRSAPATNVDVFGGGATMNINGALYFPTQEASFANGVGNSSACTQLIAGTIVFTGGSNFQDNCPAGVATIGSTNSTMAE